MDNTVLYGMYEQLKSVCICLLLSSLLTSHCRPSNLDSRFLGQHMALVNQEGNRKPLQTCAVV